MSTTNDLTPTGRLVFGSIFVAAGLFIILVGSSVIFVDPRTIHAPMWLIQLIGAAFALAGGSVMLGAASPTTDPNGALPATAPFSLRLAQFLFGLAVVASLAITGTWIAVGEGPRVFTVSVGGAGFVGGKDTFGRIVFGFGAVLCWIFLIAAAHKGWRQLTRT